MKILVLEPHLDDFELGCSVWLEHLIMEHPNSNIVILTFCSGRNKLNSILRQVKREQNLELWNSNGIKVTSTFILTEDIMDTYLEYRHLNEAHKHISQLDKITKFDLLLIPQKDLHRDHRKVNELGNILARDNESNSFPEVMEYIIFNSFPSGQTNYIPIWNTEYRINANSLLIDRIISVCEYEEIPTQNLIRQKWLRQDFVWDRMNQIKRTKILKEEV